MRFKIFLHKYISNNLFKHDKKCSVRHHWFHNSVSGAGKYTSVAQSANKCLFFLFL